MFVYIYLIVSYYITLYIFCIIEYVYIKYISYREYKLFSLKLLKILIKFLL